MQDPLPAIVDIAYHAALCTLYVTFEDSGTYTYYAVTPEVYRAFAHSRDRDDFFLDHIADHYFHWKTEPLQQAG